ncbi:hypothetical protein O9H85_31950 [Paenibacillus filicis]|uniref:Uncharacterized protein n=1 Tax=Paenibacillus gyeongsangnamensis TaxID=3388067 RepID=A0ABT4QJL6_9BACL|nr:hypothetical protein [Paenibacillus filicis]MCZ8516891.1 hypothetical protein [Paenibacillus filicis]
MRGDASPDYFGSALKTRNVADFELEHFKGKAAHAGKRDIVTEG